MGCAESMFAAAVVPVGVSSANVVAARVAFGSAALMVFQAYVVRWLPSGSLESARSPTTGAVWLFLRAHATATPPTPIPAALWEKMTF